MKPVLLFTSIMALCLFTIPMIAMSYEPSPETAAETAVQIHSPPLSEAAPREDAYSPEAAEADRGGYDEGEITDVAAEKSSVEPASHFKVLDRGTGKINEISLRDFVRGAVAAEMPASFHSEALKAQAVAAHTFALRNRLMQLEAPDMALMGADFAADPSNMKVYVTEEKAKEFYGGGETAEAHWDKVCEAADSVIGYILEYEGEPIVAAYHAISAGQTEDAANIWSGSAPYLVSVKSSGDMLAPGFETSVSMAAEEVKSRLLGQYPDMKLSGDPSNWFGEESRSDSGYVREIEIGGIYAPGKELRQVFDLRSHNFETIYQDGEFIFTAVGYGHGVGLSQYGADYLARQGYAFDEILSAYYTGAALKTVAAHTA